MRIRCGSSFLFPLLYSSLLLLILFLPVPSAATGDGNGRRAEKSGATSYEYRRTEVSVEIPDVTLVRTDGTRVSLRKILSDGRPVMAQFIFSTCPTICPVMSAVFATVREELGPERKNLRMVSFTIDPEHDTPEVLGKYAKLFDADEEWFFLTGSFSDITTVQRAFGNLPGTGWQKLTRLFLRT